MVVIGLLVAAAYGCEEPPAQCEDAGAFPGWSSLKPADLPSAALPISSCLTDDGLRATHPNHVQLTSDGVVVTLSQVEGSSTSDPSSRSLWLRLTSVTPARERNTPLPTVDVSIELDADAVPEAEPQVLQLDLAASGQWAHRWASEPQGLKEVRGPMHSPAVRSLRLRSYVESTFDYRVAGTLQLVHAAGRVSGTLELMFIGALSIERSQPPIARLGVVACFDAPVAQRGVEVESDDCGVDQIDLQGTADCGIQTAVREYGSCDRIRVLVNTRLDAVTSCVRDKLANGETFHVRVDIPLSDTTHRVVWVRGPDGTTTRYSSYRREPGLRARRCSQPRVSEPTEGFADELIACDAVSGEWMVCGDDQIFYD